MSSISCVTTCFSVGQQLAIYTGGGNFQYTRTLVERR
jgi:hypothetical protein